MWRYTYGLSWCFLIGTHGYHKDIEASRTRFQWPSLRDDVKNMWNSSDKCSKASITFIATLLQPLEIFEKKWECVSIEFINGLTTIKQMHDEILVGIGESD